MLAQRRRRSRQGRPRRRYSQRRHSQGWRSRRRSSSPRRRPSPRRTRRACSIPSTTRSCRRRPVAPARRRSARPTPRPSGGSRRTRALERGTTCWLAGLCAEPNAYRYDAANATAARRGAAPRSGARRHGDLADGAAPLRLSSKAAWPMPLRRRAPSAHQGARRRRPGHPALALPGEKGRPTRVAGAGEPTEVGAAPARPAAARRASAAWVSRPRSTKTKRSQTSRRISRWHGSFGCRQRKTSLPSARRLAEEVEHEADVAVLRVELRLVEQMHARRFAAAPRSSMKLPAGCA